MMVAKMRKRVPKSKRIERLLEQGVSASEIVRRVGCSVGYVYKIKCCVGHRGHLAYLEGLRRAAGVQPAAVIAAQRRAKALVRAKAVAAAVDAGLSYTQAAKVLGFATRGVVAGIVHRSRGA